MPAHYFYFIVVAILLSITDSFSQTVPIEVFDLSDTDLSVSSVELTPTDIYFCDEFLLSSSDVSSSIDIRHINNQSINASFGKGHAAPDSLGYGTFFMKIIIPESAVGKRFLFHPMQLLGYISEMHVNGKACASIGRVGRSYSDPMYEPSRRLQISSFVADTTVLDVCIWVSNFHDNKGVKFSSFSFGLQNQVELKRKKALALNLFIVVSLFVMSIFHKVVFLVNQLDRKSLYISLSCLIFSIDYSFRGAVCFFMIFPDLPYWFYDTMQLSSLCTVPTLGLLLFNSLYPKFISKRIHYFIVGFGLALTLFVTCATVEMRYFILNWIYSYVFVVFVYFGNRTIALLRSRCYGRVLFGFALFPGLISSIIEIFILCQLIDMPSLLPYGLLITMLLFSILHGHLVARVNKDTEEISVKLDEVTNNLEKEVLARTKDLSTAIKKLKKLTAFQEGMTHMIVNDIKGPLVEIINTDVKERDFPYLRHASKTMLNLIRNLIDTYHYNNNEQVVVCVSFNVTEVIEEVLDEFIFYFTKKSLKVRLTYGHVYELNADVYVFKRVLTNLISNAARFAQSGGVIEICLTVTEDDFLKIVVSIADVSQDMSAIDNIFKSDHACDIACDGKYKSSGLGLHLCRIAVEAHKGTIGVDSDGVNGVGFWFTLPGVSTVTSEAGSKVLVDSVELNLSSEDINFLKPYSKLLTTLEVFDSSAIDTIVSSIVSPSIMVNKWVEDIEKACYNLDQKEYEKLVHLL